MARKSRLTDRWILQKRADGASALAAGNTVTWHVNAAIFAEGLDIENVYTCVRRAQVIPYRVTMMMMIARVSQEEGQTSEVGEMCGGASGFSSITTIGLVH